MKGTIEGYLPKEKHLGPVQAGTVQKVAPEETPMDLEDGSDLSSLESIINLDDFQRQARRVLTKKTYAFISSAAEDLISLKVNRESFQKVIFRPYVMRSVVNATTGATMLNHKFSMPAFICPTGVTALANPDGEVALTKAAGILGIPYCVSNQASKSPQEIAAAAIPGQILWYQLYVNKDRSKSESVLQLIEKLGCFSSLWLTVDAIQIGKREADERIKAIITIKNGIDQGPETNDGGGIARQASSFMDQTLCWDDLKWVRSHCKLPIVVKGIQRVEDAVIAHKLGCKGISLSNHGGRQLDTAPSGLHTLLEIHKYAPHLLTPDFEIYIDGGIRRGADILKAMCLGARGCGLGRPFVFSIVEHGSQGAVHAGSILQSEMLNALKLVGVEDVRQLSPDLVNTRLLDNELTDMAVIRRRMRKWKTYRSRI